MSLIQSVNTEVLIQIFQIKTADNEQITRLQILHSSLHFFPWGFAVTIPLNKTTFSLPLPWVHAGWS